MDFNAIFRVFFGVYFWGGIWISGGDFGVKSLEFGVLRIFGFLG